MASQGNLQGPGLTALTAPLAMRQATCTFLEFAALAVQHQSQHPCCPPISPQEKVQVLNLSCWFVLNIVLRCKQMQRPGLTALTGPLAMRQTACTFLEFAALAVQHQLQHPCCPPVSPQEKVLLPKHE